jgi:hypothetical protein
MIFFFFEASQATEICELFNLAIQMTDYNKDCNALPPARTMRGIRVAPILFDQYYHL